MSVLKTVAILCGLLTLAACVNNGEESMEVLMKKLDELSKITIQDVMDEYLEQTGDSSSLDDEIHSKLGEESLNEHLLASKSVNVKMKNY